MIVNKDLVIMRPEILTPLRSIISQDLQFFQNMYPEFSIWFEDKVLPGLFIAERSIIIEERNNEIAGFAILKHTHSESKICTLRVRDSYENSGLGIKLFEQSFNLLETSTPLLSVSDEMLPKFHKIFNYFGFSHEETYPEMYKPKISELSFNGSLR